MEPMTSQELEQAGQDKKDSFIRQIFGDDVADQIDDNNREALFNAAAAQEPDSLNEKVSNYYELNKLSLSEEISNILECMTLMNASDEDLEESIKLHTGFNTAEARLAIKEARELHNPDLADKILEIL